jgi:hypothetical protein
MNETEGEFQMAEPFIKAVFMKRYHQAAGFLVKKVNISVRVAKNCIRVTSYNPTSRKDQLSLKYEVSIFYYCFPVSTVIMCATNIIYHRLKIVVHAP